MARRKHVRPVPPDSDNRAQCIGCTISPARAASPMRTTKNNCPIHDPKGYAAYVARHCPDSIYPVDRDPWSGRS